MRQNTQTHRQGIVLGTRHHHVHQDFAGISVPHLSELLCSCHESPLIGRRGRSCRSNSVPLSTRAKSLFRVFTVEAPAQTWRWRHINASLLLDNLDVDYAASLA